MTSPSVRIISFGYLHGQPPQADFTFDLRHHFRDPHVSPELRYMTALDHPVQEAVINTPGITPLIAAATSAVQAYSLGPSGSDITVAIGCAGGRHRAAVVALTLRLAIHLATGFDVTVDHRDLHRDVVNR